MVFVTQVARINKRKGMKSPQRSIKIQEIQKKKSWKKRKLMKTPQQAYKIQEIQKRKSWKGMQYRQDSQSTSWKEWVFLGYTNEKVHFFK